LRLVLDTNVIVSALISPGGPPFEVYSRSLEPDIVLLTSAPLIEELQGVLREKFAWSSLRIEVAIVELLLAAEVVDPRESVQDVQDDPDDDRVLETALAGAAQLIVSGDRHLLHFDEWRGIPILRPREALDIIGEPGQQSSR